MIDHILGPFGSFWPDSDLAPVVQMLASAFHRIKLGTSIALERFSYDLEMKAREQNRNDKRTEIERLDWFIERTDKRVWLFTG